jgi:hypothetical protein
MLTETEPVLRALAAAEQTWPELKGDKPALLKNLIAAGTKSIEGTAQAARNKRLDQITAVAGSMPETWPRNWRADLLDEWPA